MRIEKKIILLEFSFLLHEEYLVDKQNIPKNKEYTDNFIISGLCSPSIWNNDKRNTKIPSNEFIVINNKEKKILIIYITMKNKQSFLNLLKD